MASNGLTKRAKKGKCHICQRARCTETKVKPVGEINHGYAIGYIWECIDSIECEKEALSKLLKYDPTTLMHKLVSIGLEEGRVTKYFYRT